MRTLLADYDVSIVHKVLFLVTNDSVLGVGFLLCRLHVYKIISVTRLGDLLHFGQLFIACGNNYFAKIAHTCRQFL